MRVVLLHLPPSGREAPAAALAEALEVRRIFIGDLIRFHLSRRTELGIRAAEIMDSGSLLPDDLITAMVRDRLQRADLADFLLEGHLLSPAQALALDSLLHELGKPLDAVVLFHLPPDEVERRIRRQAARRICCNDCSHVFEPETDSFVAADLCDVCRGELFQREDDKEHNIRRRFDSYEAMVKPITWHYARQRLLVTVDAVGTTDETIGRAITALREHRR